METRMGKKTLGQSTSATPLYEDTVVHTAGGRDDDQACKVPEEQR